MSESGARRLVVLLVLGLTAALSPVSIDMLAPSLPGLASDIGATAQRTELTIYAFLIGYGIAPALWGRLSDSRGRRPVMFCGMLIYCLSTVACLFADSPGQLIILRGIQGLGAAAGATMARAIVRDIYGAAGTTRGMATMISFMAIIPMFMPLLGGIIAQYFSWQACFVAMAVIGLVGVGTYAVLVPETLPVALSKRFPADNPILTILGNKVFIQHGLCNMFCIATLVLFGANFAFILAQDYQFNSSQSGLVLALFNGSIALGTYLVWPLMPRLGAHRCILTGGILCSLGWATIALLAGTGRPEITWLAMPLIAAALGCGLIIALCSGGALAPFSRNSGTASSIYLLVQSFGASGLSFAVGLLLPKQFLPIALALAGFGLLATVSKLLIREAGADQGI